MPHILSMTAKGLFFMPKTKHKRKEEKEMEFAQWLRECCPWWYLLTQEQEDEYFSKWFDEMQEKKEKRKEQSV